MNPQFAPGLPLVGQVDFESYKAITVSEPFALESMRDRLWLLAFTATVAARLTRLQQDLGGFAPESAGARA